ncbi:MAG: flagellar biosynthesis protein FlhB [Ignavibacteriales bacterium]|nr:flagellar biosynthesis protein FlhB [Ignavibacteriales bacterium]
MAEQGSGQEKTEQASGKRVEETRKKGNVARSMEVNSFAIFSTGTILVYLMRDKIGNGVKELTVYLLSSATTFDVSMETIQMLSSKGVWWFFSLVAPILFGLMLVSLVAGYGQVGFVFSGDALRPKFDKMNLFKGLKRILFSTGSSIEALKSLFKLALISLFAYWMISDAFTNSVELTRYTIDEILTYMVETAFSFVWKMAIFYSVIAAADFIYQKKKHSKDLMMTKQEVKEEAKEMDGDPLIKGKIRQKQLMMARSRMMKDVPKADVIITNPTHVAIALKYELNTRQAPRVVAKGYDLVAQKIKAIAQEHNIPMHENVELARALYKQCEVGDQIPEVFFKTVAQILAFVYQQKHGKRRYIV